jgi:predicted transcriptional regulator
MTTLKIGISTYDEMKARTMAIARGKHKPKRGEPKVWFTSMESFARILSDRNRELLDLMIEREPTSMAELAELSGRAKSNLSRTLKTMERYGLVVLENGPKGRIRPRVPYTGIVLNVPIRAKTRSRASAEAA